MQEEKEIEFAKEFADFINNNWFVPINEGMWRLEVENEEYTLEVPEVNIFSTEKIMLIFLDYLQEIENNKSEEQKVEEFASNLLNGKIKDRVITDVYVWISYKPKNAEFLKKVIEYLENL